MTTERRTILRPPADEADGARFVGSLLRQLGHAEPQPDEPAQKEPTPGRIPPGAREVPPAPVRVDDLLRAMACAARTGDYDPLHRIEAGRQLF